MSACRSCDAPIKWARTAARKNMPLDCNPDGSLATFPDGNVVVTGWDGPFRLVAVVAAGEGQHRSHFASCPHAAEHRS